MPLYKTINHNSHTTIKLWKITESYSDLFSPLQLKEASLNRVLKMKSELHQRGFLSVRHLLAAFGYTDADLFYDDNGKPYLKDGKHISITHSFQFSAVIISDSEIGIDVEKQREKIGIIAHKFIGYETQYLKATAEDYINKLTVVWCIKEALYKLFATPGMVFKTHFMVIPFNINDGNTLAWIDYKTVKKRFNAHYFEFEGFTCAYTVIE
jgi:4'-phosphopantetheinyl transferase EntD